MAHALSPFASTTLAGLVVEMNSRLSTPLGALRAELASALNALESTSTADSFVGANLALARGAMRDAQVSLERVRALLERAVAQFAPSSIAASAYSGSRRSSVLAVDDDPRVLGFLRRALRDCDLMTFSDPREALAQLAGDERFDIVLSDVMMPTMTGDLFYAEVQRLAPEQAERFAFVTSGTTDDAIQKALDATGRPSLTKPFAVHALRAVVDEARARRERSRG